MTPSRFFELAFHHVVAALAVARAAARPGGAARVRACARAGLAVHRRADLLDDLIQLIARVLDGFDVLAFQRLPHGGRFFFHALLHVARDFVAAVPQRLLGGIHGGVGLVADFHFFLAPLVLRGVRLGFLSHPLHLILVQAGRGGDGDVL